MADDQLKVLKVARSNAKRSLTRSLDKATELIAEDKCHEVDRETLMRIMGEFREAHNLYVDYKIEQVEDFDEDADIRYYKEKQIDYLRVMGGLKEEKIKEAKLPLENEVKLEEVKIIPEKFAGDIKDFYKFFRIFEQVVDKARGPADAKLARLNQLLIGKPKEAIKGYVIQGGDDGYAAAKEMLVKRYGDRHRIAKSVIQELTCGKLCKKAADVIDLSDSVNSGLVTLEQLKCQDELCTHVNVKAIADRLPRNLQEKWREAVFQCKKEEDRYPTFREFACQLSVYATEESDPIYGTQMPSHRHTSLITESRTPYRHTCLVCSRNHRLLMCDVFHKLSIDEKYDVVNGHKLCMLCLNRGHFVRDCRSKYRCGQCKGKHSKYLCRSYVDTNADALYNDQPLSVPFSVPVSNLDPNAAPVEFVHNAATTSMGCDVYMPIVKVFIEGKVVYAGLDTMSTKTYIARGLVNRLRLPAVRTVYRLRRLNSVEENVESALVSFSMCTEGGVVMIQNALVADSIPCSIPSINVNGIPHLEHLKDRLCDPKTDVQLLIGQDHSYLFYPLEAVRGNIGEPYAIRTVLGWTLHGPNSNANVVRCNLNVVCFFMSAVPMSHDDVSVMRLWDEKCHQDEEGHFVLPIPWKKGCPDFPPNLGMAQGRYQSLEKKLEKESHTRSMYEASMAKTIAKFAESASCMINSSTWYLPHHHVTHPDKPDKVRIVFDCKAEVRGVSLNNQCIQGPNLVNNLFDVLLNVRLQEIVVTGDIEAMYNQVRIPNEDRDALRFLWKGQHYRMKVHLFGGVWCAASSTYALRKAADISDYEQKYKNSVYRDFYVDDWCISVETPEEGADMVKNVKSLVAQAGFTLTKFASNDESVMSAISDDEKSKSGVKEIGREGSAENKKMLGIRWDTKNDVFYFDVPEIDEQLTRRVMLSQLASVYDPFGILSPIILVGRCILQELNSCNWDDEPPIEVKARWLKWMRSLGQLQDFIIPRCVKPMGQHIRETELHLFCDGSSRAYGCVAYIRLVFKDGTCHVAFLASKSRVAKPGTTIPRLELQAAVLAARMCKQIERSKLKFNEKWFWCDSMIVLNWIWQENKKQEVFVINRTTAIRMLTDAGSWRHVPSNLNAADVVSRGCDVQDLISDPQWLFGPRFLYEVDVWPVMHDDYTTTHEECAMPTVVVQHPLDVLVEHCMSWMKIKRRVAWLIRIRDRLRKKNVEKGELTAEEVKFAERVLITHVQCQAYEEEMKSLTRIGRVKLSSDISSLSPQCVEGVIVVGGRRPEVVPRPVIIPHDHPISQRIIHDVHNIAHTGVEWTLGVIRKKFWITRARKMVKSLVSSCPVCRRHYGKPCSQRMADLPDARLQSHQPAFSHVGVDLCGPFYVRFGRRSQVKRYVCVFTCMTVRAVHLELLESLEADSFINGLRRFICRRGPISCLWSDNATNFTGAYHELVQALKELRQKKNVSDLLVLQEVNWKFIPASASHMGGCWERLIRTIRRVMSVVLENDLTDEVLHTALVEIEAIINSRPLTKVSDDPEDVTALTSK